LLLCIALLSGCGRAPPPPQGPAAAANGQGVVDVDATMATCSALGGDNAGRIAACSANIQAGNAPGDKRAIALNDRGLLLSVQGDQDRAITDFDAALHINPNYAAAFYNRSYAWR
jgi:tetratricopeptide (TPR) repeat protein